MFGGGGDNAATLLHYRPPSVAIVATTTSSERATATPVPTRKTLLSICAVGPLSFFLSRDIVLYGKSIGSVPTLHLARYHAVRGVILVSGLASGARTLSPKFGGFADGLETLAFNNLARLKRVRGTPVQLIHGTLDEIVSIEDARLMHATCKAHHPLEPCWIEGGRHNDITAVEAEFVGEHSRAVRAFLQRLLASASKEGLSE